MAENTNNTKIVRSDRSTIIKNGEANIEFIISELDSQYREFKDKAEQERLKTVAYWWSIGEEERTAKLSSVQNSTTKEELDQEGVLPPYDFFSSQLAPAIREFVQNDPHEFRKVADLSLNVIKAMSEVPVLQGGTKRFMVGHVFNQYFQFLHEESDNVVLAVAKMQAHRANLHAEKEEGQDSTFQDYPLNDYEVQNFIRIFRGSPLEDRMAEFTMLGAGINNGFVMKDYLGKLPEIVRALSAESKEVVDTYFFLAKAQKFPADYAAFQFKDAEESIEVIKYFEKAGEHKEKALELFAVAMQSVRYGSPSKSDVGYKAIVDKIAEHSQSELAPILPELLDEAIMLEKLKTSGTTYLRSINKDWDDSILENTKNDRKPFLQYLVDLASVNSRCATTYLFRTGKEFKVLTPEQREKYHTVGLNIAKVFGKEFRDYFDHGLKVLEEMPDKFNSWLEQMTNFGRERPHLIDKVSTSAYLALRGGNLDEFLRVVAYFDDGTQKRNEKLSERAIDISRDADFIHEYSDSKELGINPWKHARTSLKLMNGIASQHDLWVLLSGVRNGMDYDAVREVFEPIVELQMRDVVSKLEPIVNSNLNLFEKEQLIKAYAMANREHHRSEDYATIDMNPEALEQWEDSLKQGWIKETSEFFGTDTSPLEFDELLFLQKVKNENYLSQDRAAIGKRIQHIIELGRDKKQFPSIFNLGQSYGSIETPVTEECRFDGLEVRMHKGEIKDLGETIRTLSHSLYPRGNFKQASLGYMLHESLGMMNIIPKKRDAQGNLVEGDSIGMVVVGEAYSIEGRGRYHRSEDSQNQEQITGEKYLLVDGINAGSHIRDFKLEEWAALVYDSAMNLAKERGAKYVLLNTGINRGTLGNDELAIDHITGHYDGKEVGVSLAIPKSEYLESLYEDDLKRYDAETETMRKAAEERKAEKEKKEPKRIESNGINQTEDDLDNYLMAEDRAMDEHWEEMQQLRKIDERDHKKRDFLAGRTAPVLQSFGTVDFMDSLTGHTKGGHQGYVTGLRFKVE